MIDQSFEAIAWIVVGFTVGSFACYLICKRRAEERFYEGFRLGRAFDGFDDWLRENFGDRYGD